jgi:methylase of polypeptide subunit release factors
MLHLVLFPAYSEHNPAKHLKPPKLMEFVSSRLIMHRNIFIPTLFTEMLVVDVVIYNHQQATTAKGCGAQEGSP